MRYQFRWSLPLVGQPKGNLRTPKPRTPIWHFFNGTLNQSDVKRLMVEWEKKTRQDVVRKPERSLGAPWMDNFISQRRSVALCDSCRNRYGLWWEKVNYRPVYSPRDLTDCDGCRAWDSCVSFYPLEQRLDWAHSKH